MIRKIFLINTVFIIVVVIPIAIYLLLSGPHMKNQVSVRAYETYMSLPAKGSIPIRKFVTMPSFNSSNPLLPSKENLEAGKTYYNYYCVFCHGDNGDGNGPVGKSYIPKPSILHSQKIALMNSGEIYNKMLNGKGHEEVLKRVVPAEFRWYIVLYVKHSLAK